MKSAPRTPEPIAVIGISCRFPGGANSPEELWANLVNGVDAVGEARGDRWDLGLYHADEDRPRRVYTRAGGFLDRVDLFDAEFFGMSPREARQVDPQHRLLLELAYEAFEEAGVVPKSLAGSRTGVFVGISSNDYANLDGQGSPDAYSNTGSSLSIASNRVSYVFDLRGPSMSIDTACSSGLVSLHQACVSLAAGESDLALVGAVNLLISTRPWVGFAKASMLSRVGRCQSFDAAGDGYVRSEGGGMVLLKPLAAAERDGDPILGVILGTGVNSDGRTMGLSLPSMEAQAELLGDVYRGCGIAPEDVFYVEAHGTGTAVGDPIECESIGKILGAPRRDGSVLNIGSIKSNIGHLEPASGIAGLTKALLALRHRSVPANLHFNTPNPKILFDEWKLAVVDAPLALPESAEGVIIGVNSFGFGGTNAHVVLREYRASTAASGARPSAWPASDASSAATAATLPATAGPLSASAAPAVAAAPWQDMLVLSAQSPAALQALAEAYESFLRGSSEADWLTIKATAARRRARHAHRLVVAGSTPNEAAERLRAHLAGQAPTRLATGRALAETVPMAFVFSGNGPQWWGMGRELLASSPVFAAEIAAVDAIFVKLAGWSLLEEMRRPESESRIALTEVAQPMLFAQQLGLLAVLAEAGIRPAAVLGHSVGEVAAAYAAGALTREQATRVIVHRSAMQAQTAGLGRMAALGVAPDEARAAIAEIGGWLEIAAINAPRAVTVAGDPVALERLTAQLTEAGKFARMLPLDYPFHTRAMDPIRDGLLQRLAGLNPGPSEVPFVSTVTGTVLDGTALDAAYWFGNVREPVNFSAAIDTLLEAGTAGAFLEIGPHPVLRDYVQQIVKAREGSAPSFGTLRRPAPGRPESDFENLWNAVCAVHASGAGDVERIFARPAVPARLPAYPWQRTPHWRGGNPLPDVPPPQVRDHPLLGYRVSARDGLWQGALNAVLLPYLPDHVVQGVALFPAAGHIELGLAAARLVHGEATTVDLEGFEILRPLVVSTHADPLIQFSLDAADGTFTVASRPDWDTPEWTDHARGRISKGDHARPAEPLDLASLRSALPVTLDAAAHYAGTAARGLEYGPWFAGVRQIALSEPADAVRRALGEITLPALDGAEGAYSAHPALLDACLQVLVTLIGQNEKRACATIPVAVAHVRSFKPLPADLVCLVELERESERSGVANFTICDTAGDVLLELRGARFQKVDFRATVTPMTTEWWRPDPAASLELVSAGGLLGHDVFPRLHAIPALDLAVEGAVAETRRSRFYAEIRPQLDRLAGAYALAAIDALAASAASDAPGASAATFTVRSLARSAGVEPEWEPLLGRLAAMAEEDGALSRAGNTFTPAATERLDTGVLAGDLVRNFPEFATELFALLAAGEALPARLRGEGETESRPPELAGTAPFHEVYHRIARAALAEVVRSWPTGRPLRILELSGGNGALTAALLPALPLERAEYVFTDPSEAAVARAKHRFAAQRVVRTATFDITSRENPAESLPGSGFDLIVAAGALERASDRLALLEAATALLAPGGGIVFVESHPSRFAELVFGSDPRWWEAEGGRLQSAGAWREALVEAGFTGVTVLSDAAANAGGDTERSVFFAVRGEHQGTPASEAAATLAARVAVAAAADAVAAAAAGVPAERSWAVLLGPSDRGTQLVEAALAALSESGRRVQTYAVAPDGALPQAFLERLVADCPDEIVHLAGLAGGGSPLALQDLRCLAALRVVEAIGRQGVEREPAVNFVTRGGLAAPDGGGPLDPGQAALWGIGRVLANEHPTLGCRLIDVRAEMDDAAAGRLLGETLLRRDDETELLLADGRRYVNRVRPTSLGEQSLLGGVALPQAWRLDFLPSGGLDSLHLRETERRAPAAGEVEILVRAAGLNFRDVLWTMGMLPEDAVEHGFSGATIGMECAGVIGRVGAGVEGFAPGDRVIAFASSCFASHVTTAAASVCRIPDTMSFAEAATIPTAFLTAWYALDTLAHIAPGERLLVHGAAGGVGLAALQIAKLRGAEVIGSAGSTQKRRVVALLGADHVVNSRSLDFADEVMRITGGQGVDVVLNSLAGEAITKGLQVLRPFGRFLEIGKRDLYANSRIGLRPFRNNLSYFGIDADTLLVERPDLARACFAAVMAAFAAGDLRPLPHEVIPLSRAAEAFRAMQQSRHIGKLVVVMDADGAETLPIVRSSSTIGPAGTYLVTGGLSGFGLATAKWLVAQGARSLALVGRRGAANDEALAGIAALEAAGATVRAFAGDVSIAADVARILADVRAEMAPLRGVFHAAAVIEDAPILQIDAERLRRVLAPKLLGAWNLHEATLRDELDAFVLYSSSSVLVGNPGQASYVAANLYLDSLARYRRGLGLAGLSVGFGAIKDAGFLTRNAAVEELLRTRTGMDATPAAEALADLGRLLAAGATCVTVSQFNLARLGQSLSSTRAPRFRPLVPEGHSAAAAGAGTMAAALEAMAEPARRTALLELVRNSVGRVLGTDGAQIELERPLGEMGLDSLMAVELAEGLEVEIGRPVSVMQLIQAGSVAAIVAAVMRGYGPATAAEPERPAAEGLSLAAV